MTALLAVIDDGNIYAGLLERMLEQLRGPRKCPI
jgi:hypothetical protein